MIIIIIYTQHHGKFISNCWLFLLCHLAMTVLVSVCVSEFVFTESGKRTLISITHCVVQVCGQ